MRAIGVGALSSLLLSAAGLGPAVGQASAPAILLDVAQPPMPAPQSLVYGPLQFVQLAGISYFTGWDATSGLELWRSDGTAAGTWMVRDICPGSCNGRIEPEIVAVGGLLYFAAEDGAHGVELWRSDGTAAGTRLVKDVRPGLQRSEPLFLTPGRNGVFFVARDGVHGNELWWSDGSTAGTAMVVDLLPGDPIGPWGGVDPGPSHLANLDDATLLFAANDGSRGRELWRTDGTAAGTQLVKEMVPGPADGINWYQPFPGALSGPAVAAGRFFFAALTGDGSYDELPWVSDGTAAGTFALVSAPPFSSWYLHSLFAYGATVLFSGGPLNAPASQRTLWRSDGTVAGTFPLGTEANGGANLSPIAFTRLGDEVYFAGAQDATGRELWATDGTVEGTRLVADVVPGPSGGLSWTLRGMAAAGGRLFFPAVDATHGIELWSSDGTQSGTSLIGDLAPGSSSSISVFDQPTMPAEQSGKLLWRSIEPDGGVVRSLDLQSSALDVLQRGSDRPSSEPYCVLQRCGTMMPIDAGAAFFAADAARGSEPWVSDGSPAGTQRIADLTPGPGDSSTWRGVASLGDKVLILATADQGTGWESQLWAAAGDSVVQLTNESWGGNVGVGLVVWNGAAWFSGGGDLWRTDGTVPGTASFFDGPGSCHTPTPAGAQLFFVCDSRLFVTAGTAETTRPVAPGIDVSVEDPLTPGVAPSGLYFVGADAAAGRELWFTDGTEAGTARVVDLAPGAAGSIPGNTFFAFDDPSIVATLDTRAFFVADDGVGGEELWVTDGSPGNATLLEVRPGAGGAEPRWLTRVGELVYFVADDGTHGRELWATDGTLAGTNLVMDVRPGIESSAPRELTAWLDKLVFAAATDAHGAELWLAGGGTAQLLADLWPGPMPGSPQGFAVSNGKLFFFADDGVQGLEPWAMPASPGLFSDGFEVGATSRWTGGSAPAD